MGEATVQTNFRLPLSVYQRLEQYEADRRKSGEKPVARKTILTQALSAWLTKNGYPPKGGAGETTE